MKIPDNLKTVKSIVTLLLTLTFVIICCVCVFTGKAFPEYFTITYSTVIAFYFGTQYQKSTSDDVTKSIETKKADKPPDETITE